MSLIAFEEFHLPGSKVEGLEFCRGFSGIAHFEAGYPYVTLNMRWAGYAWYVQRHQIWPIYADVFRGVANSSELVNFRQAPV